MPANTTPSSPTPGGTVSSRQAALVVFYDDVPPNLVSARLGPSEWEVIATVNKPLCTNFSACGTDSLFTFNWEIVNADNPMESLLISSITMNGLDVVFTLDGSTPWVLDTRYTVRAFDFGGQTGIGDLYGYLMAPGSSATTPPAATAISVKSSGSDLYTFDFAPSQFEFSTLVWPGSSGDAFTVATLDAAVQTLDAASINQRPPSASGNPPGGFGTALYAQDMKNLITRPAGVIGSVLLAHLRNDTGSARGFVRITYTLGVEFVVPEEVPGHEVYYSLSCASNSWVRIDSLTGDGTVGSKDSYDIILGVSAWAPGASLYVVWVDDNGSGSPDTALEIDNFKVSAGIVDPGDITHPTLLRGAAPNNTTILLTFSEKMAASAGTTAPYTLTGGSTVTAAALSADGKEVRLTTSVRPVGNATLTITGLRDAAVEANLITPNPTTLNLTTVEKIVDWNSSWEYNTNNLDAVSDWKTTGGTGWFTGNGFFGTETSAAATNAFPTPIATAIPPPNTNNQFLTSYFRKSVNLPVLSAGQSYAIGHYTDDGAIFYLDGSEIGRVTMQPGAVSYTNLSIASSLEGRLLAFPFTTTAGSHILAVEVHQSANTSSDTVFGAQVIIVPTSTPSLSIAQSGTNAVFNWNADSSWVLAGSTNVAGPYDPVDGTPFRGFSRPIATPTTQFYKLNYVPQP